MNQANHESELLGIVGAITEFAALRPTAQRAALDTVRHCRNVHCPRWLACRIAPEKRYECVLRQEQDRVIE